MAFTGFHQNKLDNVCGVKLVVIIIVREIRYVFILISRTIPTLPHNLPLTKQTKNASHLV